MGMGMGLRAEVGVGVGFVNINLENHARQDQLARVAGATVAEAMGGGHATGPRAWEHTIHVYPLHGTYLDFPAINRAPPAKLSGENEVRAVEGIDILV